VGPRARIARQEKSEVRVIGASSLLIAPAGTVTVGQYQSV